MTDVFKANKITCSHAYSKRFKMENEQIKTLQNNSIGKTGVKILFFGSSN